MYRVVECPNCRNLEITTASKRKKCPHCGRSFSVEKNTVYASESFEDAHERILALLVQK